MADMNLTVVGPRRPGENKALWWARVEVIEWHDDHGHFHDHRLARSLFVSRTAEAVSIKVGNGPATKHKVLLPGTIIALCRVEWVKVQLALDEERHDWNEEDRHYQTLLMLQADPKDWVAGSPPNQSVSFPDDVDDDGKIKRAFTCTGGEINLDRLREETGSNWRGFFSKFLGDPEHLSVNSSGLALEGAARFVWEKEQSPRAKLLVTQPFDSPRTLHMALDRERMQAEDSSGESLAPFARSFRNFSALLRHESSVAPAPEARHRWFGLDLTNRTGVPQFRWELDTTTAPEEPPIRLARGEIQLLVSDQPPGEQDVQPRSLLTAAPEVKIEAEGETRLTLSFADGNRGGASRFTLKVSRPGSGELEEKVTLAGITSAYDPLTTATLLRRQHRLPAPDSAEGEVTPAVLWGFMPLDNGWAQLPFLNLTSQLYFDALQTREVEAPAVQALPLLSGAATFGNDAPEVFRPEDGEQPWNITLLNGAGYTGSLTFGRGGANDPWRLTRAELAVFDPEVALNGFLWLGTQTPSTADALPSLDDWLSGLEMVPLQTPSSGERFPAPFRLRFEDISFTNHVSREGEGARRTYSRPLLQSWSSSYESNTEMVRKEAGKEKPLGEDDYSVLGTLLLYGIWALKPKDPQGIWQALDEVERPFFDMKLRTFWGSLPLVWQKHPKLPAVQALPLTQNKQPPNYPSTSRQLAPFELTVKDGPDRLLKIPDGWQFGVEPPTTPPEFTATVPRPPAPGASAWPRFEVGKPAASDWKALRYLWLASLAVPGLVHDPRSADGLASDPDGFLPLQYLFGLPYTDEPNALAQLPKQEKPNHLKTPTQDVEVERPVLPLTREGYAAFWRELSEKALLARPDADEALHKEGSRTVVRGMVEPYKWGAEVSLKREADYPGVITFKGEGEGEQLDLSGPTALRGISGSFSPRPGEGRLLTMGGAGATFNVTANSMEAFAADGRQRDQRGLWRGPTEQAAGSAMLKTFLKREGFREKETEGEPDVNDDRDVMLYSLLEPLTLTVEKGRTWSLWFRDLPSDAKGGGFSRPYSGPDKHSALSRHAQDVNDPAATSSRYAHLSGYEWRVAGTDAPAGERAWLPLFGFHFFPLTLERVAFESDEVKSVEVIGRLQLPDEKAVELPELGNAVRVTFAGPDGLRIRKISSLRDAEDPAGVYGIWPLGNAGNSSAPTLRLRSLEYRATADSEAEAGFTAQLSLDFHHFNARWEFLSPKRFRFEPNQHEVEFDFGPDSLGGSGDAHVAFSAASVRLTDLKPTKAQATLTFTWGDAGAGSKATARTAAADAVISFLPAPPVADGAARPKKDEEASSGGEVVEITAWLDRGKKDFFRLNVSGNRSLVEGAMQFEFDGFHNPSAAESLHLLPGMRLSGRESVKGFAVMAFEVEEDGQTGRPRLGFRYGGLEAIVPCLWGESLQKLGGDLLKSVYGSSAGRVYAGYTLSRGGAQAAWQASLLLNGFVEVKNLVSWPAPVEGLPPGVPDRVRFQFNRIEIADIIEADKGNLAKIAEALKSRLEVRLSVEGHADAVGSASDCLKLSFRRAERVRDKLIELLSAAGLNKDELRRRIVAVGFGATLPVDSNDKPEGRENNRRVEVRPAPVFLPAANPGNRTPGLDHTRHTIRVLLNQHLVPEEVLGAGSERLLFDLNGERAWQFLAVVEHQLVDVKMTAAGHSPETTHSDRRFTVVQEVRLAHPTKFADFLRAFKDQNFKTVNLANNTLDPRFAPLNSHGSAAGYHLVRLLELLFKKRDGEHEIEKLKETLLVEASGSFWVLPDARRGSFTNLQYLPRVTQRALLSVPGDFAMRGASAPAGSETRKDWVLLSLPFLGRLQAEEKDRLTRALDPKDSHLQVDPVYFIGETRGAGTLAEIPRALSSWEDKVSREVQVSYFEQSRFRRLRRLDPATLEENWFRLHKPVAESAASGAGDALTKLSSVMASLPEDSPGRLSRLAMLARLFDEFRGALPPAANGAGKPPAVEPDDDLVWRRNNLFVLQGSSDLKNELRSYGFYFTGVQINSSGLRGEGRQPTHFAAATALPANLLVRSGGEDLKNPEPVSFAVSPYIGIDALDHPGANGTEAEAADVDEDLLLVFAELLCLNPEREGLSAVASQMWPAERLKGGGPGAADDIIKLWGRETAGRLAADSPVAVLRVRKVYAVAPPEVTISYEFKTIRQLPPRPATTKAARPVRLGLKLLRYAEGQFGGVSMPPADIKRFELAPPQVSGVQPIYLEPQDVLGKVPDEVKKHPDFKPWGWGLSALRFSVRLMHEKVGVASPVPGDQKENGTDDKAPRIWWNVASHHVQFVIPEGGSRLLPENFRARSIHSLLPTSPNLPLPEVRLAGDEPAEVGERLNQWQPVLPGGFNYFITGARAGVPFFFRHFLLRQDAPAGAKKGPAALASGAVPVQHRVPRPSLLPENRPAADVTLDFKEAVEFLQKSALQTWPSLSAQATALSEHGKRRPETLKSSDSPSDNAVVIVKEADVRGLEVELKDPPDGLLPQQETAEFVFAFETRPKTVPVKSWLAHDPSDPSKGLKLELLAEGRRLAFTTPDKPNNNGHYVFRPAEAGGDSAKGAALIREFVAGLPHGARLLLQMKAPPPGVTTQGFKQTLAFPLSVAVSDRQRLPLRAAFIQFEDPEYNRRLTSLSARAERVLEYKDAAGTKLKSVELVLATDRREYNPTSELLLAVTRSAVDAGTLKDYSVTLKKVDAGGVVQKLKERAPVFKREDHSEGDEAARLLTFDLGRFVNPPLVPGDALLVSVNVVNTTGGRDEAIDGLLELRVDIVSVPVTPTPEAGYALLRRRKSGGGAVECVRFAWAPLPQRVELVNPDDLNIGRVRRRAIYQWLDTVRVGEEWRHEIQKLTPFGSTHFPATQQA